MRPHPLLSARSAKTQLRTFKADSRASPNQTLVSAVGLAGTSVCELMILTARHQTPDESAPRAARAACHSSSNRASSSERKPIDDLAQDSADLVERSASGGSGTPSTGGAPSTSSLNHVEPVEFGRADPQVRGQCCAGRWDHGYHATCSGSSIHGMVNDRQVPRKLFG